MARFDNKKLFDFMLERVHDVGSLRGDKPPQAFGRWFAEMYFGNPRDIFISDGSGDAKIDLFFTTDVGNETFHCILNTKFTEKYNATAPVSFYNEITAFWQAFANKSNRASYVAHLVRPDLRARYNKLFKLYDEGGARLYFVTNSKRNETQVKAVSAANVEIFHLEDVLQFMQDFIENAMPRTPPLLLTDIATVLSADAQDSSVPTSIVFAKLTDFINYMEDDIFELLFSRNVRLSLGNTPVNKDIRETFIKFPKDFVFSNNGITLLCERLEHVPGSKEARVTNPRVVNGSQTLHSVKFTEHSSPAARVMVRIIQIPPLRADDISKEAERRKVIIDKISIRSNFQNPVKKWDLVSNDEFQLELARYFRRKGLYYERRKREWTYRKSELKNLGIKHGPNIRHLAQVIASFNFDVRVLGPVAARSNLAELFDGDAYDHIKKTSPEMAFQLFLLDSVVEGVVRELKKSKQYVEVLAGHMQFALFALVVKALAAAKADWEALEFTERLEREVRETAKQWRNFVTQCTHYIRGVYLESAKAYKHKHRKSLPYANFFKSQTYVGKIFSKPIPNHLKAAAKAALR